MPTFPLLRYTLDPEVVQLPLAGAELIHVVPFDVSTLPFEPGATVNGALVPLPRSTLFVARVDAPVPPLATPNVPDVIRAALWLGKSLAAKEAQAGAVATPPDPVLVKNCFAVVVLPAKRVPAPEAPP